MRDDIRDRTTQRTFSRAEVLPSQPVSRGFGARVRWVRDGVFLKVCARTLRNVHAGRMHLTLPSGRFAVIGSGDSVQADLHLRSFAAFWNSLRRGSLGFAEAYMDDTVQTHDLREVFRFFLANRQALAAAWRGQFKVRREDRRYHLTRANTRSGSRANIQAHYDLGNAFYAPWLDQSMTYSSAIYRSDRETLEHAQAHKLDRIVEELQLFPGARVLEIGCGWGALAVRMAEAGAHVTAITISDEQFRMTTERVAAAGLMDRVDIKLIDYRDLNGRFDRLVSIEMIEAVGEENWTTYFKTLRERLKPDGHAVIQAITIAPDAFETYRAKADFIQRYIFPGGMLPTEDILAQQADRAGLGYRPLQRFGVSYARTLAEWRGRFEARWPELKALGFDDRFYRMWIYYLTYCEVGFEKGATDVGLYRFSR
jgi:cyclopropane-fatty-acyl-phospholipid synthase